MSVLYCERCAFAVDTDWDTETLAETDAGLLCPECADFEQVYHPENSGLYEDCPWMDGTEK